MRKLILAVLGVLLMAVGSHAQGTPYQLDPPAPNAILRACSFPVTGGNPCSNPAIIYSDSALTQVIAQPVQLGGSGNLIFYYSSGPLMLQLTGSVNRSILVAGGGGGGTPGGASHDVQCNIASAFAPCGSATGAFTSNGATISHSESGTFSDTAFHTYTSSLLNSCSPSAEWTAIGQPNGDVEALTGCVIGPSSGGTNHQFTAVAGYADCQMTSSGGNSNNCVGGYFQAMSNATGAWAWGINPIVSSTVGHASNLLNEFDVNVKNAGDGGSLGGAELCAGNWSAQATQSQTGGGNMPCNRVTPLNSTYKWTAGLAVEAGATDDGSGLGNAIYVGPLQAGNAQPSQGSNYCATNSTGNPICARFVVGTDGTHEQIYYVDSQTTHGNYVGMLPPHGFSNDIWPGQFITIASCTMASGTCTYTYSNSYSSAPNCTATWNGTGTLSGILKAVPGTSSVVVSSTVGTDNGVVDIICGPQAN